MIIVLIIAKVIGACLAIGCVMTAFAIRSIRRDAHADHRLVQ